MEGGEGGGPGAASTEGEAARTETHNSLSQRDLNCGDFLASKGVSQGGVQKFLLNKLVGGYRWSTEENDDM